MRVSGLHGQHGEATKLPILLKTGKERRTTSGFLGDWENGTKVSSWPRRKPGAEGCPRAEVRHLSKSRIQRVGYLYPYYDRTVGHPDDLAFFRFCDDYFVRLDARERYEENPFRLLKR